ncbi:histidine kinase [Leptospira borgpetersenii]|uniref:histidine kinase n=1 Tax=Leptospira borgpetersenii TaxID=174 RepID=UPI000ACB11D1
MLFSNELNYWVIKKNAKKDLLLRIGAPYQSQSQKHLRMIGIRISSKDKVFLR